MFQLN